MLGKILHFVKYNNTFTIIFVLCFFSFGITFAANPDLREAVYSSEETVVSVDNGRIVSADLDSFNFNLRIKTIDEDRKNYYAAYSYQTLAIEDGVWREKEVEKTLTVSKEALGGKDLGLYMARELGENMNYELSYLKRVQKLEIEKGESQKVLATEYSGLIGKLLDPKEEVIEGYTPVIAEIIEESQVTPESNPAAVIVSTPYAKPKDTKPAATQTESMQNSTSTQTSAESAQRSSSATASTSASEQTGTAQEQTSTSTPAQSEPSQGSVTASTSTEPSTEPLTGTPTEIGTETSAPPQDEPVDGSEPETPQDGTMSVSNPAPEEMIDEELVQEVVEELLQDNPAPPPEPMPESVPEPASEPVTETTTEPAAP